MIGMVAFIVDVPGSVTDPGTVLPVQIFMWADFAERMFVLKTSAAIMVLLAFLILMNAAAIIIRKKLERLPSSTPWHPPKIMSQDSYNRQLGNLNA